MLTVTTVTSVKFVKFCVEMLMSIRQILANIWRNCQMVTITENFECRAMHTRANLVDLEHMLQNESLVGKSASTQPRTRPPKFATKAERTLLFEDDRIPPWHAQVRVLRWLFGGGARCGDPGPRAQGGREAVGP